MTGCPSWHQPAEDYGRDAGIWNAAVVEFLPPYRNIIIISPTNDHILFMLVCWHFSESHVTNSDEQMKFTEHHACPTNFDSTNSVQNYGDVTGLLW